MIVDFNTKYLEDLNADLSVNLEADLNVDQNVDFSVNLESWMSPHVLECICIFTLHLVLHLTIYIDCTFAYYLI